MFVWKTDGERSDTWSAYAQQHGYELLTRAPRLRMRATSHGLSVDLTEWVEREQPAGERSSDIYVRRAYVSAKAPVEATGILAARRSVGADVFTAFGGREVELGDPDFDPLFRVRALEPGAVARVLTPAARAALALAAQTAPDLELRDGIVRWIGTDLQDAALMDKLIPAVAFAASRLGR